MGTDDIVPSVPQGGGSPLPFSVRPDRFNPASMAEAARAIEALLTEHGVQLSPGSWMGRAIAETAVRLPEEVRHDFPVPPDAAAQRQRLGRLRKAGDLLLLSKALESARGTLSIADLRRSLKVLAGGFHELTAKTQQSRERDLAFELMVAGWVGKYSTDVTLVEPDIVCRFEDTVWGLACKTVYGGPHGVKRAIRDGIRQIERERVVEAGLIFVRVRSSYGIPGTSPSPRDWTV